VIRLAVGALVLGACGSGGRSMEAGPEPRPRGSSPPTSTAGVADLERCAEYRGQLAGWGHGALPGEPGEARIRAVAGDRGAPDPRPVPIEDEALAAAAPHLDEGSAVVAAGLTGPRAYVRLRGDVPAPATLDALRGAAAAGVEVRALVARSTARRVADFVAVFPHTPAHLSGQLGVIDGFSAAARPLVAMAGGCGTVLRAMEPVSRGIDARALGPAMADALGACGCRLADLDGFVTLFAWIVVPRPEMGWVPIQEVVEW